MQHGTQRNNLFKALKTFEEGRDMQSEEKASESTVYDDSIMFCEHCKKIITEPTHRQKFCGLNCKDQYHKEAHAEGLKKKKSRGMHFAKLSGSPRLERLLKFLADGEKHTTWEIQTGARLCNVGTTASELRRNGFDISCKLLRILTDKSKIYEYQLVKHNV